MGSRRRAAQVDIVDRDCTEPRPSSLATHATENVEDGEIYIVSVELERGATLPVEGATELRGAPVKGEMSRGVVGAVHGRRGRKSVLEGKSLESPVCVGVLSPYWCGGGTLGLARFLMGACSTSKALTLVL